MANWTFDTPTVEEGPAGKHRLFYFYRLKKGITIIKSGGVYSQVRYGVDSDLNAYDEFYLGGHRHTVNDTIKAALIAGGVGVTESNFTAQ